MIREFKNEPLNDLPCFESVLQRLESDLGLMRARANAWATGSNASTVAVLPMRDILRPDGYLARLRASGYVVDEPPQ